MTREPPLLSYAVFAGFLAAAGLPLYIHAPKYFVDEYGVSLAALGAVLFGLRLFDVIQDPVLGRLAGAMRHHRALGVLVASIAMALGMIGLFAVPAPIAPLWWFGLTLSLVFSGFSFLTIVFYATGVQTGARLGGAGHIALARWRETGALIGVCAAAVAPALLGGFAGFAIGFGILGVVAVFAMRGGWASAAAVPEAGFAPVLRDGVARRLLLLAFVNAAPVAISSTLFLFFVESRLSAPGSEGPLLLLFFLSAALAAPFWGRLAQKYGARPVLLAAMVLSIVAFVFAVTLGAGDVVAFAAICAASGAAMGADMTLLPAMFAARMAKIAPGASGAFGLWSFVSKLTLAIAAVAVLPALDWAGFQPGAENSQTALWALSLGYGALPCLLKVIAIAVLASLTIEETQQ